jgi:hypothetical protein
MITLELPAKMLRFLIEAVEFQSADYATDTQKLVQVGAFYFSVQLFSAHNGLSRGKKCAV